MTPAKPRLRLILSGEKPRLRLVTPARPLAHLSRAEKLSKAIAYLRERNLYVLDIGAQAPKWGVPGRGKA